MDETEIRKQVISRYENGESPKQIYQSPGKSKKWFFKQDLFNKIYNTSNDSRNFSIFSHMVPIAS